LAIAPRVDHPKAEGADSQKQDYSGNFQSCCGRGEGPGTKVENVVDGAQCQKCCYQHQATHYSLHGVSLCVSLGGVSRAFARSMD